MPLTVGGGIRTVEDMREMLLAGADKVGVNTAAVNEPELSCQGAEAFGSQCIVVAIDAKRKGPGNWSVYTHGGRTPVGLDAIEWAKEVARPRRGRDPAHQHGCGRHQGGIRHRADGGGVSEAVGIPVIASGGAGNLDHMVEVLRDGKADAVLAASIFHFGEYTVGDVKEYLAERDIPVRPFVEVSLS